MPADELTLWQRWFRRPQNVWLRRALFQIHLWTGIGTGLYVVLISVTGSAIVFRNEIYQNAGAGARIVQVRGTKLPADDLKKIVRQKYPDSSLSFVFEGKLPNTATEVWLEHGKDRLQRLFDPYTGADLGDSVPQAIRVAAWLAKLHTDLLYGETGRKVNGIGAIFLTLAMREWFYRLVAGGRQLAPQPDRRFSIQLETPQLGSPQRNRLLVVRAHLYVGGHRHLSRVPVAVSEAYQSLFHADPVRAAGGCDSRCSHRP